jgi:alpha-L-fucosidase
MDRRKFIESCALGASALMVPGSALPQNCCGYGGPEEKALLNRVEPVLSRGPFADSWDSLKTYQAPSWYEDSKFGIFIHWGVYSVPAYMNEWYPRNMYLKNNPCFWHHRREYGPQDKFGYKDFIPMFKAEKFDANSWAELFKKAGANYVVPVAEHHDGFAMYDTKLSNWSAARMGPRRDVLRELADAVRKAGMVFGLSSHRSEHWWFFNGGRKFKSDVQNPAYEGLYGPAEPEKKIPDSGHLDNWLARCIELVDNYQPRLFYFDWWIEQPAFEPYRKKFAAYFYNRGAEWKKGVALNYKNQAFPEGAAVLDLERSALDRIRPLIWQTDTSVSYLSWGFINKDKFKKPSFLIKELVDIVSKNGRLLLNVGPRADGVIPEEAQNILLEMGKWLSVNGDAVYGTRPWRIFGEGPTNLGRNKKLGELFMPELTAQDIRFTTRGKTLYAVVMGWPEDGKVEIKSLGKKTGNWPGEITSVRLLGSDSRLKFVQGEEALAVSLPAVRPCEHALALEIK